MLGQAGQNEITKNVHILRKQLEVVRDKFKLSSFWSSSNQVRIGRYDTKFYYNGKPEAWSHRDSIDVNINPAGHFACDFIQLCR